jgi:large subunit ribosomal protein L37Ae
MVGSSKKFGVRYGRRLRLKHEAVEEQQKTKYKCPYCHKAAVKRMAVGIWNCPKCSVIFTARAYTVPKKAGVEEAVEEVLEESQEVEEDYAEEENEQQETA